MTMPALFVGHGSPMNALEDNAFTSAWRTVAGEIPRPRAILCVSAHWQTEGPRVTAMERPRTIHDFYGFPPDLFRVEYPAPGAPWLAERVVTLGSAHGATADRGWGLDHGAWSVLIRMFPDSDIPVVQLALDTGRSPAEHFALARSLRPLRDEGVLVLGSGNIVHNLGMACFGDEDGAYDWAVEFDETIRRLIAAGDHAAIVNYDQLGKTARLAIPTNEHFLPLLYVLALREEREPLSFFAEGVTLGTISMRAFRIG